MLPAPRDYPSDKAWLGGGREEKKKNQRNQNMSKMYRSSFAPQSAIHLGGIDCIFCTQPTNREKKKQARETVRCADVLPTQNDHQQYNTQSRETSIRKMV